MKSGTGQWVIYEGKPMRVESGVVIDGILKGDVVLPYKKGERERRAVVERPLELVYRTRDKARESLRDMVVDTAIGQLAGALGIDSSPRETFADRAQRCIDSLHRQLDTERATVRRQMEESCGVTPKQLRDWASRMAAKVAKYPVAYADTYEGVELLQQTEVRLDRVLETLDATEKERVRQLEQHQAADQEVERLKRELASANRELEERHREAQCAAIRIEELGCFRMMLLAQRADLRNRLKVLGGSHES